jgi:hypothetical protein
MVRFHTIFSHARHLKRLCFALRGDGVAAWHRCTHSSIIYPDRLIPAAVEAKLKPSSFIEKEKERKKERKKENGVDCLLARQGSRVQKKKPKSMHAWAAPARTAARERSLAEAAI